MQVVLVVGIGRSGTSAFTGVLAQLGYAVPQPEVQPDDTNPRGFGEPQWVVDFQTPLLRRHHVANFDGRPEAWGLTRAAVADGAVVAELRTWLSEQMAQHERLVVKDPRTVWLFDLWLKVAHELDVPVTVLTMLRAPAEVVASARRSYGAGRSDVARLAGWVNVMLHTELATRGTSRAFVGYDALLRDWRTATQQVAATTGLDLEPADGPAAAVDDFLDPGLRRVQEAAGDIVAPARLRDLSEQVWAALASLVAAPADATVHARLDVLRADYVAFYEESAQVTEWTVAAARADARKKAARRSAN